MSVTTPYFLTNTRKTDALRRGVASGFLAVWRRAYAAFALPEVLVLVRFGSAPERILPYRAKSQGFRANTPSMGESSAALAHIASGW